MSDAFMLTATGREYKLAGSAVLIDNAPSIRDIAHHLAIVNRYTGATTRPYSVAEHSLLVERLGERAGAPPGLRMALLMHDAHEAFTNDQSTPSKRAIGLGWIGFEATHATNVRTAFGLRTAFGGYRAQIDRYDHIALATERRDITVFDPQAHTPWPVLDTPGREVLPDAIERIDPDEPPLDWRGMRAAFMSRFLLLRELVAASAPGASA